MIKQGKLEDANGNEFKLCDDPDLSGYYTKEETYAKTEIDTKLNNYPTKEETDTKLTDYATSEELNTGLDLKIDKSNFLYYEKVLNNLIDLNPVLFIDSIKIPKEYITEYMILSVSVMIGNDVGSQQPMQIYTKTPYTVSDEGMGLNYEITPAVSLTTTYDYPEGEKDKLMFHMKVPAKAIATVSVILMKKPLGN